MTALKIKEPLVKKAAGKAKRPKDDDILFESVFRESTLEADPGDFGNAPGITGQPDPAQGQATDAMQAAPIQGQAMGVALFESVFKESVDDDDDYDTWEDNENMMHRANDGVDWDGPGEYDDDGNLNDDRWMKCGLWEQCPDEEEVIQAVRDGDLDEDEAKKILRGFGWSKREVEFDLQSLLDDEESGIESNRRQHDVWAGAGLDDDSIGDGSQFDDPDYHGTNEEDYDDGSQYNFSNDEDEYGEIESEGHISLDDLEDDYEDEDWN
jgi:hypothetical protein